MHKYYFQERRRYEAEKATEGRRTANELRGIKEINKVRKPQNRSKEEQKREIEAAKNSTNERILRVILFIIQNQGIFFRFKCNLFLFFFFSGCKINLDSIK